MEEQTKRFEEMGAPEVIWLAECRNHTNYELSVSHCWGIATDPEHSGPDYIRGDRYRAVTKQLAERNDKVNELATKVVCMDMIFDAMDKKLKEAMELFIWFCMSVSNGEVRSKKTYEKFREFIASVKP